MSRNGDQAGGCLVWVIIIGGCIFWAFNEKSGPGRVAPSSSPSGQPWRSTPSADTQRGPSMRFGPETGTVLPPLPTVPEDSQAQPVQPAAFEIDLHTAVVRRLVQWEAQGAGLDSVSITLRSLHPHRLRVRIAVGTLFVAGSSSTQNMLVLRERTVELGARATSTVMLDTACANMHLDTPDSGDRFSLSPSHTPADLLALLALREFQQASSRVQQFGVWTITDNPTRSGYVGIGAFGFGSGPSGEEIETIRRLFVSAGIHTTKYRALTTATNQERPRSQSPRVASRAAQPASSSTAGNRNSPPVASESAEPQSARDRPVPVLPRLETHRAPKPKQKKPIEEEAADALAQAKNLVRPNPGAAQLRLEVILSRFPETRAAAEARALLDKMKS